MRALCSSAGVMLLAALGGFGMLLVPWSVLFISFAFWPRAFDAVRKHGTALRSYQLEVAHRYEV
jgi:hypothetical protein